MFFERHAKGDRIIVAHCFSDNYRQQDQISEFEQLALAANTTILQSFIFTQVHIIASTFLGGGKLDRLQQAVVENQAEVVLFNIDLSPSQERNIEKIITCRVLSRTGLILDIFASRAKTYEGKLQVELAQLQNLSTRLVRGWTHLERQKGGIGMRGPGESQLEIDKRLIQVRIKSLKKDIAKIKNQRAINRRSRQKSEILSVALVGYTNAGKSSLFNLLTQSNILVKDQLFATLDTTIRPVNLPTLGQVAISDTVGFIQRLPHALVESFHATLEETCQADLLLHIVDTNHPSYQSHIEDVNKVLREIGADQILQLLIYNKIDLRDDLQPKIQKDQQGNPIAVWLSTVTTEGCELLSNAIVQCLSQQVVQQEIQLSPVQSNIRAQLYQWQCVEKEQFDDRGNSQLHITIPRSKLNSLQKRFNIKLQDAT